MMRATSIYAGVPSRQSRHEGAEAASECLVVMYHYVHDALPVIAGPSSNSHSGVRGLSRSAFIEQVDGLLRIYEPVDWPTFFSWREGRTQIAQRSVLFTFDDGLADHAKVVLPIMEDRGLRGVFFVPGAVLTRHRLLSAHAIHLLLNTMSADALWNEVRAEFEGGAVSEHFPPGEEGAMHETDALRIYHYESPELARLKYLLTWRLPVSLRNEIIDSLFEKHVGSNSRWARHWYLDWASLIHMQQRGHTIGGHGFEHEPYARLSGEECRRDARRVAELLRDGLGAEPRPFSYPFGSTSRAGCAAVREAGFVQAFTTRQAPARRSDEAFILPRIDTIAVEMPREKEQSCLQS